MTERHATRRLVAVLAADVVGYSAMMSRDEAGTLAALKQHREEVFNPAVEQHNGRIIKLMGDGTLVEFVSAVDAIECAIDVQRSIMADRVDAAAIILRIGVNLGDVILDGEDIYGNGVNIAARLEPLASPGGMCVSSVVKQTVGGRLEIAFEDGGIVSLKNIDEPVHIWHWKGEVANASSRTKPTFTSRANEKVQLVSIAVLPFDNMSGEVDQSYFSDGVSEDIITDLSKVTGLRVIARNSSFAYKGQSIDLRTVGRELGVANILEGSVRRSGNRVRITAQLIDAASGSHIWAERYDRNLTDIFEVQDEVTLAIVAALKVALNPMEVSRVTQQFTKNTEAYDHYLRARSMLMGPNLSEQVFYGAIEHCERAIDLDPSYAAPYASIALAHLLNYQNVWTKDAEKSLNLAGEYADRAVELCPEDPLVYHAQAYHAQMTGSEGKLDRAIEKSLELDPRGINSLMARAMTAIFRGHPEDAFEDLEEALRGDPSFTHQILHFIGLAHFFLGNFEAALVIFRERVLRSKDTDSGRVMLASTLGHLGKSEEAAQIWEELRELHPKFSYRHRIEMQPYQKNEYRERIYKGLKKAGVADE